MLKNVPLKIRLMVYSTLMIIVVVSTLASILLYHHHNDMWSEFKLRGESMAEEIAHDLKIPVVIEDKHSIETVVKVIINVGCGEAAADKKIIERVVGDITLIS